MAVFNDDISINTILGAGSFISGDVRISGFARIDGDIDGNLEASGNVIIGDKSRIKGNISAKSVTVGGLVKGSITATESVHVLSSGTVIGDIQTRRFKSDENALIHGHCIALSGRDNFDNAVQKWENMKAFSAKSVLFPERT